MGWKTFDGLKNVSKKDNFRSESRRSSSPFFLVWISRENDFVWKENWQTLRKMQRKNC